MKTIHKIIILCVFFGLYQPNQAQRNDSQFGYPRNDFVLIPRFSKDSITVRINVKNLLDDLVFIKTDSLYQSNFIVDYKFESLNTPGRIYQRNLSEAIETSIFKETNSKHKYAYLKDNINIEPDNYLFSLKGYSGNGHRILFNFSDTLKWDTQKDVTTSDFVILKNDSSIFVGRKNIPFGLYGTFLVPVYWSDQASIDSIGFYLYTEDREKFVGKRIIKVSGQRKYVEIPEKVEILPEGKYELYALFYSGKRIMKRHKQTFNVKWMAKPWALREFGLALKPLETALGEEYDHLFNSSSASKEKVFKEYWKRIDPTPDSEFNELQSEFYTRADEVHLKYGSERRYGWETDFGEIYLKYGPPEEVNDQSLNPHGDEYIEWTYKSAGLQFVFLFDGKMYKLRQVKELKDVN